MRVLCLTVKSAQVNPTFKKLICTLQQHIMRLMWYSVCLIKGNFPMVNFLIKEVA